MKFIVIFLVCLSVAQVAGSIPISGNCDANTLGLGIIDLGEGHYIIDGAGGIWLWEESNVHPGLQRGNAESILVPGDAQECYEEPTSDTLIL